MTSNIQYILILVLVADKSKGQGLFTAGTLNSSNKRDTACSCDDAGNLGASRDGRIGLRSWEAIREPVNICEYL